LDPNDKARRKQQLEGFGFRNQSASGRDHHGFVARKQCLEAAPLVASIRRLSVQHENLGECGACGPLDLAIELDKGDAAPGRELRTQRGFARATQADKGDSPPPRSWSRTEVAAQ